MAIDPKHVLPVADFLEQFASEVATDIEKQDAAILVGFKPSPTAVRRLGEYAQERFRAQLKALHQECASEAVPLYRVYSGSLRRENYEFILKAAGLERRPTGRSSKSKQAIRAEVNKAHGALTRIQRQAQGEFHAGWRKLIPDLNPRELTVAEAQRLRDTCPFQGLPPDGATMYGDWNGPKSGWRLKGGSVATRRAFRLYAKHAASVVLGEAPDRRSWQRWLYLLMFSDELSWEQRAWDEGEMPGVCEASATFIESLVLDAERRSVPKSSDDRGTRMEDEGTAPPSPKPKSGRQTPLRATDSRGPGPSEERRRLYKLLEDAGLIDHKTGKVRKSTQELSNQNDVFDKLFSEVMAGQAVPDGCRWDVPGISNMKIDQVWEVADEKAKKKMKSWVRALVRDCFPHREASLQKATEEKPA